MPADPIVLESRKFRVARRAVTDRAGSPRQYDYVVHPGAAVILPILSDGRVVLIRNTRFAIGTTLWELPAGTLDPGEAPAACAARELKEETGYDADRIVPMLTSWSSPGFCTERLFAFLATGLRPGTTAQEADEDIEIVPIEYDRAIEFVRTGEVSDGKTITALLFYDRFVKEDA